MNIKEITMGIVATIVALVIVVVCAIPIISDSVATEDTYKNDGYFYVDKFTDTYTFSWNYNNPEVFVINGEEVEYTAETGSLSVSVFCTDSCAMRYVNNTLTCNFYGGGTYISGNATYPEVTATLENGTLTVTNGTTTKPIANTTEVYSIVKDGPFVMKNKDKVAYLNGDSEIYASGQTFSGSAYIFCHLSGTIDDGISYGPDNLTFSNQTVNYVENNTHEDLYELTSITFTAVNSNNVEFNPVYSYFIVPAEVTAERTVQVDGATGDIITVIPVLMVLAILIGAVTLFIKTRRD